MLNGLGLRILFVSSEVEGASGGAVWEATTTGMEKVLTSQ